MTQSLARATGLLIVLSAPIVVACGVNEPAVAVVTEVEDASPLTDKGLRGVWGSSADDVWVVGAEGVIFHYDGEAWLPSSSGTVMDLQAVHGTGWDDVWAVGEDTVLHFDGQVWTEHLPDQDIMEVLLGVWCERSGKVWMSGVATDVNEGVLRVFERDAGGAEEEGRWEVATAAGSTSLWDVWGAGPGDIWSGGTATGGSGFVVRGDGLAFDLIGYEGGAPRAIWGSATDDVWIAPYVGAMHHWDGLAWTAAPGADVQKLLGAGGSGRDDAWAVGLTGAVLHWDGAGWEPSTVDTVHNLSGVWAASRDDAWIVGARGTLLHWDGSVWTSVSGPPAE
jgi:hypothetical protein